MEFVFTARLWEYEGAGSWHFVTLPRVVATEILESVEGRMKPGGTVAVEAVIGRTKWKTSLFRDTKRDSFLLPVKALVRGKEQLRAGDDVEVSLRLMVE